MVTNSKNMSWYKGDTVLEQLDKFKNEEASKDDPFRMFVQDVYKFTECGDNRRIVAGTISSGSLSVGDEVIFYPSQKKSKVKSIEVFNGDNLNKIGKGYAASFTLDEQIYITRGELVTKVSDCKPKTATRIKVNLFWVGKEPMQLNKEYILKVGTAKVKIYLEEIIRVIDASNLNSKKKDKVELNEVAECILKLDKKVAFDLISYLKETSRFVIVDDYRISGGGIINAALEDRYDFSLRKESNLFYKDGKVNNLDRCKMLNQKGMVIWFTGLSGAGKSTIAIEVEKRLFEAGKNVYRLDGDNIRYGLNSDLGFSKEDRLENIRRIAEVAYLFKDAGFITLVSFITPYEEMRELARKINNDNFYIAYVKADLEVCADRDPKGLYKKAKKGEIKNFTGISAIYEEPKNVDILIESDKLSIEEASTIVLEKINDYQNNNENS